MYFSTIEAIMLLKTNEVFRKRTQNELKTKLRLDCKIGAKRAILVEFACGNKPTRGVTGGYIDFRPKSDEDKEATAKDSAVTTTDNMAGLPQYSPAPHCPTPGVRTSRLKPDTCQAIRV
jgi:hypothetical protein